MNFPLEKQIQRAILDFLRVNKICCWKNNNTGIYKKATNSYIPSPIHGVADIIGLIPHQNGRFIAIEVKRPNGKQTDCQKIFEEMIKENNGIYILTHSVDELEKQLKELNII